MKTDHMTSNDSCGNNPATPIPAPKTIYWGLGLILIGMVALMTVLLRYLHLRH